MFNTAFIQNGNYIKCGKMELSPEDIRKDKGKHLPNDFKVYIFFDDFCDVCEPHDTELEDLCERCKKEIGPSIMKQWYEVREICKRHSFPGLLEGQKLLPGVDHDEMRALLEKQL